MSISSANSNRLLILNSLYAFNGNVNTWKPVPEPQLSIGESRILMPLRISSIGSGFNLVALALSRSSINFAIIIAYDLTIKFLKVRIK